MDTTDVVQGFHSISARRMHWNTTAAPCHSRPFQEEKKMKEAAQKKIEVIFCSMMAVAFVTQFFLRFVTIQIDPGDATEA